MGGFSGKQVKHWEWKGLRSCGSRSGQDEGKDWAMPHPNSSSQAQSEQFSSQSSKELPLAGFSARHLAFVLQGFCFGKQRHKN